MTVALYDEVVIVPAAPKLKVVRDATPTQAPAKKVSQARAKKVARKLDTFAFLAGDPLVEGATRLLSVPVRHVYAALWRAGVLHVQA